MALWDSKILYIFLEVTALDRARAFWEEVFGLEVIENEFHPPHHRHGVVKYDAGDVIVALNVADRNFDRSTDDGILMVFSATPMREAQIYAELRIRGHSVPHQAGGVIIDQDNHWYALRQSASAPVWADEEPPIRLQELHIGVDDMAESLAFYMDTLGLVLLEQGEQSATFATGNVKLVLKDQRLLADWPQDRRGGPLIVFRTGGIERTYEELSKRGVKFKSDVVYSDIGGSVRFTDPAGHTFCLYEESEQALRWGSGRKVKEIIAREGSPSLWQVISDT